MGINLSRMVSNSVQEWLSDNGDELSCAISAVVGRTLDNIDLGDFIADRLEDELQDMVSGMVDDALKDALEDVFMS